MLPKIITLLVTTSITSGFLYAEDGPKTLPPAHAPQKQHPVRPSVKAVKVEVPKEEVPEWEKKLREKLERRISFDFVDTPLADCAAFWSHMTGTNIVMDIDALAGDDNPVTLKVADVKLRLVIDWTLRMLNLTSVMKNGALFITTKERAESRIMNCIIHCRDYISAGTEKEFLETLQELSPGAEWETGGTMLRFIDGRLIIRNRRFVTEKLEAFVCEFIEATGGPNYTPWIDEE